MKKITLFLLSLIICIIGALLVIPSFMNWNSYKTQIKTQLSNATGYKVDLNGDLSAAILPYPHIAIKDVTIDSNGVKGPYDFTASVKEASVSVALIPLLSGSIIINDISLIKPIININQTNYKNAAASPLQGNTDVKTSNTPIPIQINKLYLEKASLTYKPLKGETSKVSIPVFSLKADNIYGPYEFDGDVQYQNFDVSIMGSIGEYDQNKTISTDITIGNNLYTFTYSGLVDLTQDIAGLQGEVNLSAPSLHNLAAHFGSSDLPIHDQDLKLSGMISGSAKSVTLKNGQFSFGDAAGTIQLDTDNLNKDTKSFNLAMNFSNDLNLDSILESNLPATNTKSPKDKSNETTSGDIYNFLPNTIEIPNGINLTYALNAPKITYQDQSLQGTSLNTTLKNGSIAGQLQVKSIPGGGDIKFNAQLEGESSSRNTASNTTILSNPTFHIYGDFALDSLRVLTVDWLNIVDTTLFETPQIPTSANGKIDFKVKGNTATLKTPNLTMAQYDIRGMDVIYNNAQSPKINANIKDFEGATIKASGTLNASDGINLSVSHQQAAKFIQTFQPDFKSTPNLEKPFSFNGTILKNDAIINIPAMTAKIGKIDVSGAISADTSKDIPSITADLVFGNLDTQALLTGEQSTTGKLSGVNKTSTTSTDAPWTRDAIDTSFLRAINVDLNAKAAQLDHGTWRITNPTIDIDLNNGVLDINTISGELHDGTIQINGQISAKEPDKPMSIATTINTKNINLGSFVQSALAQNKKRITGTGDLNLNLSTSGVSSSALIYALNGDGTVQTSDLIVHGLDLAKITEAISDESLSDLGQALKSAFNSGQTSFQPVNHPITIREGTIAIDNLTLQSDTANLIADGDVNFAQWNMNLKNSIQFTGEYDDLPTIEMSLKGPLNAPQQNVASDVLMSFITNKYGDKIQKAITDKLGKDNPANAIINNILGLPQPTTQNTNQDPSSPQSDNNTQENLLKGLINQFGK